MLNNSQPAIGTPFTSSALKVMLLGAGELGKEVVLEFQRFGVEVIAVDRYDNAPAMQVAHRSYTISMLDSDALRRVVEKERPNFIIPEVEAIATTTLIELEREGHVVIPTATAAHLTMNREGIRTLAAEKLGIRTSPYRFVASFDEFVTAIGQIGYPCVVKPIMSSSGKGAEFRQIRHRHRICLELCTGRWPQWKRYCDSRRVCRF